MKITILCTSASHPVNAFIEQWVDRHRAEHDITVLRSRRDLTAGEFLFLISCGEFVNRVDRARFSHTLVLHASDLPEGRGWNPHIWQILHGAEHLTVTLLEAEDRIDSGAIWHQIVVPIDKAALWNEVNNALFDAEMKLLDYAIEHRSTHLARAQRGGPSPVPLRLRTPADSRLDPDKSIAEQFDLIRICDPERYPAFFELHGHRFKLVLEKFDDDH